MPSGSVDSYTARPSKFEIHEESAVVESKFIPDFLLSIHEVSRRPSHGIEVLKTSWESAVVTRLCLSRLPDSDKVWIRKASLLETFRGECRRYF